MQFGCQLHRQAEVALLRQAGAPSSCTRSNRLSMWAACSRRCSLSGWLPAPQTLTCARACRQEFQHPQVQPSHQLCMVLDTSVSSHLFVHALLCLTWGASDDHAMHVLGCC